MGLIVSAVAFINVFKLKNVKVQWALLGLFAFMAILMLIVMGMDANGVLTARDNPICFTHQAVQQPNKKYDCDEGGYIAMVLMDLMLLLTWAGLAVFSFFYLRKGWFATEVCGEQEHVDYFGEAERYFPSDQGDDGDSLTGGNK